jgi:hypothetical protein
MPPREKNGLLRLVFVQNNPWALAFDEGEENLYACAEA